MIYVVKFLAPTWHAASPFLSVASWIFFACALGLIGWSALWFFRKKTPIEPHHQPKTLIVEGPYRLSRNPIYLALVMLTIASAMAHGSILGLVLALALWKILDTRFAAPEEQRLREAFGTDADRYFQQTRRWL